MDSHKNVVEILDNVATSGWPGIIQYSEFPRTHGTIEFWVRFNSTSEYLQFASRDTINNEVLLRVSVEAGKWRYRNIAGTLLIIPNVKDPVINTWTHIKIDFRCNSAPSYLGLGNDRFVITIDGISSGELEHWHGGEVDYNWFGITTDPSTLMTFWVDAVGFSWDPNYNIGDNLNEGLLLSYDNITTLDWQGYSLDGQANRTILGNTTILMPSEGTHQIQVFGNDTMSTMYESTPRYFTINKSKYINIITPDNKTYTQPDEGYYPAIYGFENDMNGDNPDGWTIGENPPDYELEVVAEKEGHKKVVHIYDNWAAWNGMTYYPADPEPTIGTIEFWVLADDCTTEYFDFQFRNTDYTGRGAVIQLKNDKWECRDGASLIDIPNAPTPQDNTWIHVSTDFRCIGAPVYKGLNAGTYEVYINGVGSGEMDFAGGTPTNSVGRFSLSTSNLAVDDEWWIDAVGFSWDPDYDIGDNLNEGLLLSYDNSITLDWQAYSLDGQANKTIMGNTTIPLPSEGTHQIQVFGNETMDNMYKSEVRHFSVDTFPPQISISYPSAVQEFSNPPAYVLLITEDNVAAMWYTLNGGSNIPFTSETGTIDSSAWNSLANSPVTIRFYVRDIADREVFEEVTVVKIAGEVPTPPSGIPGYNVIALVGITFAVTLILAKRRLKK